jgi:hypothetical protein
MLLTHLEVVVDAANVDGNVRNLLNPGAVQAITQDC